jgi:BirA family biotin operon repressor/biotin-[acetyl-CoA-carboxylase] ligase
VLLAAIAASLETWLQAWDEGRGFATVRQAWLNRAHPIGERLSINTGPERVLGTFSGLDPDGALLLAVDGDVRRFTFGDVSLAR